MAIVIVIVIAVDIVEGQAVMTMDIVGLQDVHRTEVVIILRGILHTVEDQGGTVPGHLMAGEIKVWEKLKRSVISDLWLWSLLLSTHSLLVWSACFLFSVLHCL